MSSDQTSANDKPSMATFAQTHSATRHSLRVPIDPLRNAYRILLMEFLGTLLYTLFGDLLGAASLTNMKDFRVSIAAMDGLLLFALMCTLTGSCECHFNPAITLARMLTLNIRLLIGTCLIVVQFFAACGGAILCRALLSHSAFVDAFSAIGVIRRHSDTELQADSLPFSNRIQLFVSELILSSLVVFTFLVTADKRSVMLQPAAVSATRIVVSLIGFQYLGQTANLGRAMANNVVASIFLYDDSVWRFFYIAFFAAIGSSFVGAGFCWLLRALGPSQESSATYAPELRRN